MTRTDKVLIIGLDGATFDLIGPWAEAGCLPGLARLMRGGVHGRLQSTLPPVTSPAWPSFLTGKNPGKHGVFDFITPSAGQFGLVNATHIKSPTIWDILSEAGRKVGSINVPVTYPPRPVNGFMVTGLLSPSNERITYPPDLLSRYKDELGPYRVTPNVQYKPGNEQAFIADLQDMVKTRGRYALRLLQDQPWDCAMVHFLALDVAQHALWRHMDESHPLHTPEGSARWGDAIRDMYALVDGYVGQMVELAEREGAAVMVMSDHGFGPLHYIVNLNMLLLEAGLLQLRRDVVTQLRALAFRSGLTPAGVYHLVAGLGMQDLAARVPKETRNAIVSRILSFESVDWSRTRAYSMGHVGQIYVNLRGREPHGIVEPGAEYEAVLDEVEAALRTLRHPDTSEPLLERTIRRDEACHGPYCDHSPDMHIILDGYRCISFPLFATEGKIITRQIRGDSGCHRAHGIFIAAGPGIKTGQEIEGAHITDLAPTLLHLLGLPVPDDMDGRVLTKIMDAPGEVAYARAGEGVAVTDQDLTADERAEIEDRLRQLGYLG
jgi:predicted AlkP superfamily phosphohydrolase/phosphomutase